MPSRIEAASDVAVASPAPDSARPCVAQTRIRRDSASIRYVRPEVMRHQQRARQPRRTPGAGPPGVRSRRLRKPTPFGLAGSDRRLAGAKRGRSTARRHGHGRIGLRTGDDMAATPIRPSAKRGPAAFDIGRHVRANLSVAELYEDAIRAGDGVIAAQGPLVVRTGKHTGRSPRDKFIVKEPSSASKIWWGEVNRPISEQHYERLRQRLIDRLADRTLYAQDCFIGAHPAHRRSLRVYTETAWASIFAENLFRRPSLADLDTFRPNFTIIDAPSFRA